MSYYRLSSFLGTTFSEYNTVAAFGLHVTQLGHGLLCLIPMFEIAAFHLATVALKAGFAHHYPATKEVLLQMQLVKAQWLILALHGLHVDSHAGYGIPCNKCGLDTLLSHDTCYQANFTKGRSRLLPD